MHWFIRLILAWAIIIALAFLVGDAFGGVTYAIPNKPTISVVLNPTICQAPCAVRVTVTIEGYEVDREVCIAVYDSAFDQRDDATRRSCWPWTGRKFTDVHIGNIGPGLYDIIASLEHGEQAVRQLRVSAAGDMINLDRR